MAIQKIHESLLYSRNAGADLSAKLHYFCKVDTDGDIILTSTARTDATLGVIVEAAAENSPVTVQTGGIGKVVAGEAIAAGERITCGNDGRALDADTAGDIVVGIALHAADANDLLSFVFMQGHVAAS